MKDCGKRSTWLPLQEPSRSRWSYQHINQESEEQRKPCLKHRIMNVTSEEAWIICILMQTKLIEDRFDLWVPVTWAAFETIKCSLEEPVFVWVSIRITIGRFDVVISSGGSVLWQKAFSNPLVWEHDNFHSHTDNETHCIGAKDWCVLISYTVCRIRLPLDALPFFLQQDATLIVL